MAPRHKSKYSVQLEMNQIEQEWRNRTPYQISKSVCMRDVKFLYENGKPKKVICKESDDDCVYCMSLKNN